MNPRVIVRGKLAVGSVAALMLLATCKDSSGDGTGAGDSASGSTGSTGDGTDTGTTDTAESSSSTTATDTTDTGTDETDTGDVGPCVEKMCGNKLYECGDCIDNDNDGTVDAGDIECLGPCDDDEDAFATGIPGDNADPCKQDCFWDGDSGQGNDGCDWNLKCDPENPGGDDCPYNPDFNNCPDGVTEMCKEVCNNTPPGCDCFGCCTVTHDGMEYDIYLGDDDCSLEDIENTCESCQKFQDCNNECEPEKCEQCFGEELPDGCEEPECPEDQMPCESDGEGGDNCPEGYFCLSGCCTEYKPPP